MSLYSALQKNPKASLKELEKAVDGNLCRCTGYRPIVDALKALSSDSKGHHTPDTPSDTFALPEELKSYQHESLTLKVNLQPPFSTPITTPLTSLFM